MVAKISVIGRKGIPSHTNSMIIRYTVCIKACKHLFSLYTLPTCHDCFNDFDLSR